MTKHSFDEQHILTELKHYLPSQTPLKDFIHHNTLHAFQHMKFFDGIYKAGKIFGYQVTLQLTEFRELHKIGRIKDNVLDRIITQKKGAENLNAWKQKLLNDNFDAITIPRLGQLRARWKTAYKIDLDNLVQPLLFRILGSYLDQGIAIWKFPVTGNGLLDSIRELEKNGYASLFKTETARSLLMNETIDLKSLLDRVVGREDFYEQYIFDQQFTHHGWSGIIAALEDAPHSLYDKRAISLRDLVALELLLEIDALENKFGKQWKPLCQDVSLEPLDLFADVPRTEIQDVLSLWQDAFEWSYYDNVLAGLRLPKPKATTGQQKSFQAIFCIDERECSIRRHLEASDPEMETLGTPGFFGVEFYFQPQDGKFYDKLCPAPVTPKYLVKETAPNATRAHEMLYTHRTHTFITGFLSSFTLGFFAGLRTLQNLFRPKMSPAISNALSHMHDNSVLTVEHKSEYAPENGLQVGFTVPEMATRVEGLLRGIGLIENFSPLIYAVAHGSSSANNPHHSAHDCGACSGKPGSVNSRVFAHMANHPEVRAVLEQKGILIPDTTQFVGGIHDTAADQVAFYDVDVLTPINKEKHLHNLIVFDKALDLNAMERSRRFASINTKASLNKLRKEILKRSVSMFEPRPELGHGTNTLCIIGPREMTKGLFLDRRAFLNSYNYKTDPEGLLLTGLMRPIGPVCGGINLEYYFSRVDNLKLGAGTKLPHNVMGLIGVANSSDGDLRPGLPVQMIEVHDPVRLLVIVEHFPEVVLKTIQTAPEMYEWYINEWVHIAVIHPETKDAWYFKEGAFVPYEPLAKKIETFQSIKSLVETAKEMETNYIVDATQENLPIYTLN